MITFPNAKINIGLYITSKREDGYHNIESCLYPIPWTDVLEIVPCKSFSFEQTGLTIPGEASSNLCVKAYELLLNKFDIPTVQIHLHKIIPMGAGLGGGSADGAFTLKMLNQLFDLAIPIDELKGLSALLGSDCPFFIDNIPSVATETGTNLTPINLDLSNMYIGMINPNLHISTAEAYSGVTPKKSEFDLCNLGELDIKSWQQVISNDFETSVFKQFPTLSILKQQFLKEGAVYSAMSGSGSTIFGLFEKPPATVDHYTYFSQLG
ncbi:MAG: 4-(cytidine 5'-diphospho)-2-C-methyl-D-erythritol kinase [Cyclobacteriaceae bacterium]